jgi:hypothetical protein
LGVEAVHLIDGDVDVLPDYRIGVRLDCSRGVHTDAPDYASQLGVVWYVAAVSRPLLELVHDAVRGLNWERLAEDYAITLM